MSWSSFIAAAVLNVHTQTQLSKVTLRLNTDTCHYCLTFWRSLIFFPRLYAAGSRKRGFDQRVAWVSFDSTCQRDQPFPPCTWNYPWFWLGGWDEKSEKYSIWLELKQKFGVVLFFSTETTTTNSFCVTPKHLFILNLFPSPPRFFSLVSKSFNSFFTYLTFTFMQPGFSFRSVW